MKNTISRIFGIIIAVILLQLALTLQSQFRPNWGRYRSQQPYLTFTYQNNLWSQQFLRKTIAFNIPSQLIVTEFHDGQNQILSLKDKSKQKLSVKLRQQSIDQYAFQIQGQGKVQIFIHQKPYAQCQTLQVSETVWVSGSNVQSCPQCQIYRCSVPLNISSKQSALKDWKNIQTQNQERIDKFMKSRNISNSHRELVKYSIVEVIKSIRVQQSEFPYFLVSQGSFDLQRSVRLSLLPIDIIGDYNKDLGKWLCQNFLNYYQKQLLYSGRQFYLIPQHIEVVLKYYNPKDYGERSRIESLLIGIVDSILLAPVNHIQEQMNYRQSNKIHPTIFKMLTIKFQTESPQLMASSIYTQSFMEDLFYHGPQRKLQMAMAKYMWLMKVIALCQFYSPQYKYKLNYVQGIIKTILKQDQALKKGFYRSTTSQGKMRFYVPDISYQSLLPFTYGVTDTFPSTAYQNLTTPVGLTALPVSSLNYQQQGYRYRANIHLYFNKLFCSGQQNPIQTDCKNKVKQIITNLWAKDREIYTIWSTKGQPVESLSWLKIIATTFI